MEEQAVVVRFEDVHKAFGPLVVLDGMSFDLHEGRTLAIMGPSGTGKSVALKHIVGLLKPDAGRVLVRGQDVVTASRAELADIRRRMGYVFQEGALINWLNVGENVALPLRENTDLSDAEIRDKSQEKLELVRIPDSWSKMTSEISGGMKKRVSIARALVMDPELILYDEPNAGLDPEIARSINDLMVELQEELGVTSLVVEHRVECIQRVADQVIFLEKGRVLVQAPPEEFFHSDHPRLVRFFGIDGRDT